MSPEWVNTGGKKYRSTDPIEPLEADRAHKIKEGYLRAEQRKTSENQATQKQKELEQFTGVHEIFAHCASCKGYLAVNLDKLEEGQYHCNDCAHLFCEKHREKETHACKPSTGARLIFNCQQCEEESLADDVHVCVNCKQIYCKSHFEPDMHACEKRTQEVSEYLESVRPKKNSLIFAVKSALGLR